MEFGRVIVTVAGNKILVVYSEFVGELSSVCFVLPVVKHGLKLNVAKSLFLRILSSDVVPFFSCTSCSFPTIDS